MSERYPDEYWLADFERRLHDGRLLTREESLGLIAELLSRTYHESQGKSAYEVRTTLNLGETAERKAA